MKIHPTAIIEPGAKLGPDCEIGPGAIIGKDVTLGARCVVQAHAVFTGTVVAGDDNFFGYGVVIGAAPQDFAWKPEFRTAVRIGNGNTLREYVTIHTGAKDGTETVIGDKNFLMVGCHAGHNVRIGNRTVIANNCLLAGYVEIHDNAVLGGGTVFHQFMRVGRFAMVRGGTRFGKDIPPFTTADRDNYLSGLNVVGLRRNGFSAEVRAELSRAYKLVFRSGYNISQALEAAHQQKWGAEAKELFDFISQSKRGVSSAMQRKGGDSSEE